MYWVNVVERQQPGAGEPTPTDSSTPRESTRPSVWVIWERFPKFIFGFFAASALATLLFVTLPHGESQLAASREVTKTLMSWFFALAFISIGLEIDFVQFRQSLKGGKPLVLYVCGQTFNIVLTLAMAWLMFEVIFKDDVEKAFAPTAAESEAESRDEEPAREAGPPIPTPNVPPSEVNAMTPTDYEVSRRSRRDMPVLDSRT